ncbi:MAG: hypothetical protein ABI315_05680 [Bacteroidia bacterium]
MINYFNYSSGVKNTNEKLISTYKKLNIRPIKKINQITQSNFNELGSVFKNRTIKLRGQVIRDEEQQIWIEGIKIIRIGGN